MLPYVFLDEINLGPIVIHFWGLMVSLGFIIGLSANYLFCKKREFNLNHVIDLGFWIMLCSLLGARLFYVIFYDPSYYFNNPVDVFKFWHGGLSSIGGILGAVVITIYYFKKNGLRFWKTVDYFVFGFPLGMAIGRIGCAFVHDHPGIFSDFVLAVAYPGGGRHDLGLYLVFFNLLIFILFLLFKKYSQENGFLFKLYLLVYGIGRFLLDFLRVWDGNGADARYFNLTPAQWVSMIFIIVSLYFIFKRREEPRPKIDQTGSGI